MKPLLDIAIIAIVGWLVLGRMIPEAIPPFVIDPVVDDHRPLPHPPSPDVIVDPDRPDGMKANPWEDWIPAPSGYAYKYDLIPIRRSIMNLLERVQKLERKPFMATEPPQCKPDPRVDQLIKDMDAIKQSVHEAAEEVKKRKAEAEENERIRKLQAETAQKLKEAEERKVIALIATDRVETLINKARREKRFVMVVGRQTDCPHCDHFEELLKNSDVRERMRDSYLIAHINQDVDPGLAKKYGVDGPVPCVTFCYPKDTGYRLSETYNPPRSAGKFIAFLNG